MRFTQKLVIVLSILVKDQRFYLTFLIYSTNHIKGLWTQVGQCRPTLPLSGEMPSLVSSFRRISCVILSTVSSSRSVDNHTPYPILCHTSCWTSLVQQWFTYYHTTGRNMVGLNSYSKTSDRGPSEIGTVYNRPLYEGHSRRGQPLYMW